MSTPARANRAYHPPFSSHLADCDWASDDAAVRAALKREARALDRRTDPARNRGGGGGGGGGGHKVRFWSVSADEAADDADDEMEEGGAGIHHHEGEAGMEDSPLRVGFYLQSARVTRPAPPDDPHQLQRQHQSGDREEESDGGPRRTIIEV